jgi:hypothetical protein
MPSFWARIRDGAGQQADGVGEVGEESRTMATSEVRRPVDDWSAADSSPKEIGRPGTPSNQSPRPARATQSDIEASLRREARGRFASERGHQQRVG